MEKKIHEAREIMRERRNKKRVYVKTWQVTERVRRRTNHFVTNYVKHKFGTVYSEAVCFYDALEKKYPNKRDLCKTSEYRQWKESVSSNKELAGTVQILITETTLNQGCQNRNELTRCTSETVLNGDQENSTSSSEQSDTDSIHQEQNYNDNFILEIPLETYSSAQPPVNEIIIPSVDETPPVNEIIIPSVDETPPVNEIIIPPVDETPPVNEIIIPPVDETPPFNEMITDERIREIIEELQGDPDLNDLFNHPQPVQDDQLEDEGVELPSLEEEIELDFEPFDFDIEVEQGNW